MEGGERRGGSGVHRREQIIPFVVILLLWNVDRAYTLSAPSYPLHSTHSRHHSRFSPQRFTSLSGSHPHTPSLQKYEQPKSRLFLPSSFGENHSKPDSK